MSLFDSVPPTFAQYCDRWAAAYNAPPWVSALTARIRIWHLRRSVLPIFGAWPIHAITVAAVSDWQQELLGRGVTVGYARHIATSFSAPLEQARREGLIDKNPLRGLRWPRRELAKPDPYSPRETRRLLRWFGTHKPDYLPLVALVCLAGLRPSEACGLRWEDIDFERGVVRIERSSVQRATGPVKTRRSARRIQLPGEVVEILRAVPQRHEWVCTTPEGRQVASTSWGSFHWQRACKAAGVRYRGFYRGRAGFLSARAAQGANLLALAEYSGTSIRMLEAHYLRWMRPLEVPGRSRRRGHA